MRSRWICAVLGMALVALSCGGSDPEADLAAASAAVEKARARVAEERESVQALENAAEKLQKQLAESRAALRDAESELAQRESVVNRSATDSVLFRAVQKRLLEDGDLSDVAIAASVSKGVVTLSGSVPDAKLRDRALDVARATPGVVSVESRIDVQASADEKGAR